jgi:hypothetical protein
VPGERVRTKRFTGPIGDPQVRVIHEEGFTIYGEDRIVLFPGSPRETSVVLHRRVPEGR